MKPLRVLHVIGGDDTGGAMSYVLALLRALREEGCDARLLCLGDGGLARSAAADDIPVDVLPMSHPWDGRVLPALRRHLAGGRWDVVHTHGMRANLPVRATVPTVAGGPLLFTTVHSALSLDYTNAAKALGYQVMDRLSRVPVDAFCCVSDDLARELVESGVPRSRVYVVHPGVELSWSADRPQQMSILSSSGTDAAPVIGTVTRLVKVKDLDLLLEAMTLLVEQVPAARLIIAGDGPERPHLEELAAQGRLADRVEFLGQVLDVRPVLAGLDVFAMTSLYEGLGISALEAMTMGVPVVATAVGGLSEVVEEGVTGLLVPRGPDREATAAALAAALARLLFDGALRARMGEAGKARAAAKFSAQAAGARMLAIYRRELGGARERVASQTVVWESPDVASRSPEMTAGSPDGRRTVSVLGFRLDLVTIEEAARWVLGAAHRGPHPLDGEATAPDLGGAAIDPAGGGRTAIAVSFNPELVMAALEDPAVGEVLRCADLAYPDGVGAVWAARRALCGESGELDGPERVAGIDLARRVLELAADAGLPVYFLGAEPGVAEEAAAQQCRYLPGLQVAGCRDGYFPPSEEREVVAEVRRSGAAIVLVAMGAPRQEMLLHRYRDQWGAGVALGIGGSLDVWAGRTVRAPEWVRHAGLEWLYRLAREPRRLRRQLVLPRFVLQVVAGPAVRTGALPGDEA